MRRWLQIFLGMSLGGVATAAGPPPARDVVPPSVLPASGAEPVFDVVDLTPAALPGHPAPPFCEPEPEHRPGGWFASGEYLIWRPRLSDAAYALVDPRRDLVPQGRIQNVIHDTRGGLRVGTGYRLPGHDWDVGVTYTYFESEGFASAIAPPGGVVYPLLTRPGLVDQSLRTDGYSGLEYHIFDLDFGRTIVLDPSLSLRAFGGVRFASIESCVHSRSDGLQARVADVSLHSRFDGVGPTAGAEARFAAWRQLTLFGNARGGLVYGSFASDRIESNRGVLTADIADRHSGVAPFAAMQLGGSWRWRSMSIAAGYEVTHWFDVVSRATSTDDFAEGKYQRRQSDLSFDGVFFRLAIGY